MAAPLRLISHKLCPYVQRAVIALTGGFALQHGLAHVLGGSFGIAHGPSHALVLPYVAAYNSRYAPAALQRLAEAIGARSLGAGLYDLARSLHVSMGLSGTGLSRDALDEAARITLETDDGDNPGPVTFEAVRDILEQAWQGKRPD